MAVSVKCPTRIVKRDGTTVDFDPNKIEMAFFKCYSSFDREPIIPI